MATKMGELWGKSHRLSLSLVRLYIVLGVLGETIYSLCHWWDFFVWVIGETLYCPWCPWRPSWDFFAMFLECSSQGKSSFPQHWQSPARHHWNGGRKPEVRLPTGQCLLINALPNPPFGNHLTRGNLTRKPLPPFFNVLSLKVSKKVYT